MQRSINHKTKLEKYQTCEDFQKKMACKQNALAKQGSRIVEKRVSLSKFIKEVKFDGAIEELKFDSFEKQRDSEQNFEVDVKRSLSTAVYTPDL